MFNQPKPQNVFQNFKSTIRPKLDYLIKKQVSNDTFVPFANERDGLNRLLPKLAKCKENQIPTVYVPGTGLTDNYISYKSNKLEQNKQLLKKRKKSANQPILKQFIGIVKSNPEMVVKIPEKFEFSVAVNKKQNGETSQSIGLSDVSKLIFRNSPNFSFSKTLQKTIIETTIEESRKHDYGFIDANRAKDFLLKKNAYIPNYSKASNSRINVCKNKIDHHEYLMKLLSPNDETDASGLLNSPATFDSYKSAVASEFN